ncbi:ATP-binding protein [Flavobacterium sp. SUN046]|uniref:ATP-binding protein n=1 Tax=Flavobacterium sp. SUN046 TaxID=3002440 RepID=UPI002DB912CF|nr:ATP-binding protein [Flavobacterium sp. SUN046]MEC4048339.1 ATP-binding protein [Flavobacterium sp. SUN046]
MIIQSGNSLYKLENAKSLYLAKITLNESYLYKDNELIAKSYNMIGLNFEDHYDYKTAIQFYYKALSHANKTSNDTIKDWIYNNLGNVYTSKKVNFKKGISYYKKGLVYSNKLKDSSEITYTELNLANAFFNIKDYKNGIKYLDRSCNFVKTKGELEAKITLYTLYGMYHSALNQNETAEQLFETGITYAKQNKVGIVDDAVSDLYKNISLHYKKNKQFEKALYYLGLHEQLQEKIYNDEQLKKVKAAGTTIEIEEYQRELNKISDEQHRQSKDLKESKLIVLLFVIIFFILILLLFSLYKNNKFRDSTNEELKLANQELKLAKERAEVASQLKTQFVSTISHELRTPLYGVVGITNIILEEHKELVDSPHLNSLKFSARYLLSLVNDLLQINKIEENKIVLENMIFNISDEISTIIDSLEFIAVKNKNKLTIEIDEKIPEFIIGDKLRLSQVFMNLVSNALKFTKEGEVKIIANLDHIEGTKFFITFQVKDNGVGIAKEDQEKIFEKFVQIERKEGDYQGTGLGLSIVQKLIELFGSEIHLESEEGKGTNFTFTIAFETDEAKKNEIIGNIEVDLSTLYLYKILVVEDNKINQVVTKKILENNKLKCTIVDDGYAAINLLETEKFDIVLMDINMPIINGFETTKLIRNKGITIPIVALTAFDKQEITEDALAAGMNDIIIKPFESAKLIQIISSLINQKNAD